MLLSSVNFDTDTMIRCALNYLATAPPKQPNVNGGLIITQNVSPLGLIRLAVQSVLTILAWPG